KYYEEIGDCFPELLRLKELLKLGALSRFMQSKYEATKDYICTIEKDTTIDECLTKMKRKISGYTVDEEGFNKVSNMLCKQFYCKKGDLKPYLSNWLYHSNHQQALTTFIKQTLIKRRSKLKETMDKLGIYIQSQNVADGNDSMSNVHTQCSWVPAVFSTKQTSHIKVYGGVTNILELVEETNIKANQQKRSKPYDAVKSFNQ
ncbi:unnamed protein product, partial [Didymodactylos carnosus]